MSDPVDEHYDTTVRDRARTDILTWDWQQQPDLTALAEMVTRLSGGRVHIVQPDTGGDEYAIVLSTVALTVEQATEIYHGRGKS